jgi:hypothetical protein
MCLCIPTNGASSFICLNHRFSRDRQPPCLDSSPFPNVSVSMININSDLNSSFIRAIPLMDRCFPWNRAYAFFPCKTKPIMSHQLSEKAKFGLGTVTCRSRKLQHFLGSLSICRFHCLKFWPSPWNQVWLCARWGSYSSNGSRNGSSLLCIRIPCFHLFIHFHVFQVVSLFVCMSAYSAGHFYAMSMY